MADPISTPQPPAPAPAPASDMVPRSRLNDVIRQRDEATAALQAATAEVDTWRAKAATVDSLTQKFDADRKAWEAERQSWQTKSAAYQHGVTDPDLVDLALWQYERAKAPESGEKPSFGEWLGAYKAAPDTLPAPLAGLKTVWAAPAAPPVGAPAPEAASQAAAPQPGAPTPQAINPHTGAPVTARPQPSPNAGAVGNAPVPQQHVRGSISNMTDAEYRAYRKTVGLGG